MQAELAQSWALFEHMPWYKERLVYTSFADQDVQMKDNA